MLKIIFKNKKILFLYKKYFKKYISKHYNIMKLQEDLTATVMVTSGGAYVIENIARGKGSRFQVCCLNWTKQHKRDLAISTNHVTYYQMQIQTPRACPNSLKLMTHPQQPTTAI